MFQNFTKSIIKSLLIIVSVFLLSSELYSFGDGAPGTIKTSFNPGTGADQQIMAIAKQSSGKLIIAGYFDSYNSTSKYGIARLNTDGTLDGTFTSPFSSDKEVVAIIVQSDDKIICAVNDQVAEEYRVYRLTANGSVDFNTLISSASAEDVMCLGLQSDGKIIAGGYFTGFNGNDYLTRLDANGDYDDSFNPPTLSDAVMSIAVDGSDNIFIGGYFTNGIKKLSSDGNVDGSFDVGTGITAGADPCVNTIALHSNGDVVIGGNFTAYRSTTRNNMARINSDGSIDTDFSTTGTGFASDVNNIQIDAYGRYIVVGNFSSYNSSYAWYIARLSSNGTFDSGFTTGSDATIYAALINSDDGDIYIVGNFTTYNGTSRPRVALLYGELQATVTTTTVSNIYTTIASSGGNVTSDGGASVTAKGVVWSTTSNPALTTNETGHTSDGTSTGSYTSNITGLTPGTTYHVRAYATNSAGTAYGTDLQFTSAEITPTMTEWALILLGAVALVFGVRFVIKLT